MIRKYHNHKLKTNLGHCEEESHDNHEAPEEDKQIKEARLNKRDNLRVAAGSHIELRDIKSFQLNRTSGS